MSLELVFLTRISLLFVVFSFLSAALSLQSARLLHEENSFPFTFLFVFSFAIESGIRSTGLFFGSPDIFFTEVKKSLSEQRQQKQPAPTDILEIVWNLAKSNDDVLQYLLQIATLSFAIFFFFHKIAFGGTFQRKTYSLTSFLLLVVYGGIYCLTLMNCSREIDLESIPFLETKEDFSKLLSTINICIKGPFGLGDALINIALLIASLNWQNPSSQGLEHTLFFRWILSLLQLWKRQLKGMEWNMDIFMNSKNDFEAKLPLALLIVQAALIFVFFVPRYAKYRPVMFLLTSTLIGIVFAITSKQFFVQPALLNSISQIIGQSFLFALLGALITSGGMGISSFFLIFIASASQHAPWFFK